MFSIDPINLPKLFALCTFSFGILSLILLNLNNVRKNESRIILILFVINLIFNILTLFQSGAPMAQQLFGMAGRNTGFVAYFSLNILFLGAALLSNSKIEKPLLIMFSISILINLFYGFLQSLGLEPANWKSAYSPIIGTMGNPNFYSSLLGIAVSFYIPFLFERKVPQRFRFLLLIIIFSALYLMLMSHSIQGPLIVCFIIAFYFFIYLLKLRTNKLIISLYISIMVLVTFSIGAGLSGNGLFANFLKSDTLNNRIDYWLAGIKMFKTHLFFGVGFDSYGDWYRATRSFDATLRHGPTSIANSAHNVFIDIAANSGLVAISIYLIAITLGIYNFFKEFKEDRNLSSFRIAIFLAWIAYLLQSMISINNLGLASIGWILMGLNFASRRWKIEIKQTKGTKVGRAKINAIDYSGIVAVFGVFFGFILGFLPFKSDANFRSALQSGDGVVIYKAALAYPTNSERLKTAIDIYYQNEKVASQLEIDLAREAIKFNSRSFDSWAYLYRAANSSLQERKYAISKLLELDPFNEDIRKWK